MKTKLLEKPEKKLMITLFRAIKFPASGTKIIKN